MSDTVPDTPGKASRAAWSEGEKVSILFQIADLEGRAEGKAKKITLPLGRTLVSVERMITRLRDTINKELEKEGDGAITEPASTTKKAATPRKRKTKADTEKDGEADNEGSPKKKLAADRKKAAPKVKEEVKEEEDLNEAELDAQVDQLPE